MKKVLLIILGLILTMAGCFCIWYSTREWEEFQQFVLYYYGSENDLEDDLQNSYSVDSENKKETDSKPTSNIFSPSFIENYPEDKIGYAELDRSNMHFVKYRIQCDNMLTVGSVSIFLCDDEGNILYKKEKIKCGAESFMEEFDHNLMKQAYYLYILDEAVDTKGEYRVTFWGK